VICDPCAEAADAEARFNEANPDLADTAVGHPPEICRDHKLQPAGCACRHRPAGSATTKETARA
jgi:hypothetical protein